MCKVVEEEEKSSEIEEYEYGDTDLEFEEYDEDADEFDAMYMELEQEEKIYSMNKEDFEKVEELKPPCISRWYDPKRGQPRRGIQVVARKDDAQVDFHDYTNLSIAAHLNAHFNSSTRIPKRTDHPDIVCPICYEIWTTHGDHQVCFLPCGHVYGMSCIKRWIQAAQIGTCPQCHKMYKTDDVRPIYATRICNLAADQKAPIRRFSFSRLGYITFKRYEFARRNYAWNKRQDTLKQHADAVGQHKDAMKRQSELLDRRASILKRANALEHRYNASRRANALHLRANALGQRADEYLQSAKTFRLRAKALHERASAFSQQVSLFNPRRMFYIKGDQEDQCLA